MIMSSVDLPEPDGPTIPTASPLAIVRPTSRNICTRAAPRPRLRSTPRIATAGRLIVSEILKAGPPSYGHWRPIVQAAAFAAALALAFAAPASARTLKLVALGDSLTAGYGLPPGKAFPDQLEAALKAKGFDVTVVNAGVSGDTAEDGLARYDWAVPPDADALIVELGANDMLRGLKPEETKTTLAAILDRAKAAHLPTLLAGMRAAPNLGADYDRAFDAIYPALAEQYGAVLYPVLPRRRRRRPEAQPAGRPAPDSGGGERDRPAHPAVGGRCARPGGRRLKGSSVAPMVHIEPRGFTPPGSPAVAPPAA